MICRVLTKMEVGVAILCTVPTKITSVCFPYLFAPLLIQTVMVESGLRAMSFPLAVHLLELAISAAQEVLC